MNLAQLVLFVTSIFLTNAAHALVERSDTRCVRKTVEQVHSHLINYANYKNIDGASEANLRYDMAVDLPTPFDDLNLQIPLINMTYSEPVFRQSSTNSRDSDAIIWVVLQPYTLNRPGDRSLLPRFYLHCRSLWNASGESFNHTCDWIAPAYRSTPESAANPLITAFLPGVNLDPLINSFGIGGRDGLPHTGFHSELTVTPTVAPFSNEQTPRAHQCAPGETRLQYSFSIEPNAVDIQQVKPIVMHRFIALLLNRISQIPGIGSLLTSAITPQATATAERNIAPLFDENNQNNFYGWYYTRFYNAWANSIPGSVPAQ